MKFSTLLKMMQFWPPFLGAGISVKSLHADGSQIVAQMKMRFWNKNYVGTHYGGSIYSMTDPFYMLMLMHLLGKGYIVWDKSASIRYKKPAKGTLYARFELTPEQVEHIRLALDDVKKIESEFIVPITDETGVTVAEVKKTLSIAKK